MLFIIALWILLAMVVGAVAAGRGRSGLGWFLLAVIFTPIIIGIVLLVSEDLKREAAVAAQVADSKTCPQCAETVKRAARTCRFCQYQFTEADDASLPKPSAGTMVLGMPRTVVSLIAAAVALVVALIFLPSIVRALMFFANTGSP
jgi:ribosomal protein L37AE/L43A